MKNKVGVSILVIALVIAFLLYLFAPIFFSKQPPRVYPPENNQPQKSFEPKFTKHGELRILSATNNATIANFDIEVVQDMASRARGLMHRRSMEDQQGMLFIFEEEALQSFWMRNTYISLDIIFIDSNKKIVHIAKNTPTLSDAPVPSLKPAIYVLEINAGLSNQLNINIGDSIEF